MGVKNSNGMKKFQKRRNECSGMLHSGLKQKNDEFPEPETFEKLIEWSLKQKTEENEEEKTKAEPKSKPIENMVDILITFAQTYLKIWSKSNAEAIQRLERVILPIQIHDLLNRIKNLLNASPKKANELYLDVFSTIFDIGMISLKITRLLQGKNDSYSIYSQAFEKCTLEYYENVDSTGKSSFIKLLEDKNVQPENFMEALVASKFLSDLSVHSELLENPSFQLIAKMIKQSIRKSITEEEIEKLNPKLTSILDNGTLLQLCCNKEIFSEENKHEFYANIQQKFCLMIRALIDYPEIFDAMLAVYDIEEYDEGAIEV